jgi:Tol biopolymer transport system component
MIRSRLQGITFVRLCTVVLLLLAGSGLTATAASAQGSRVMIKVVAQDFIVVRAGPSDGAPLVADLPNGTVVPAIGDLPTEGWWQVKLSDGRQGWVNGAQDFVEVVDPPAVTTAATTDSLVAFQDAVGGGIYIINADGTNLRYLTIGIDPAISPDRQWVAFTRWDPQSYGLFLIKTDGTGEHQLYSQRFMKAPAWSPDGTRIAVTYQSANSLVEQIQRNGKWKIAVVRVADGYFSELPSHDLSYSPTWSPDGQKIAYASDRGISLTWENATAAITRDPNTYALSTLGTNDRSPAWSPDGKRIAFQYKKNDRSEIYLMSSDGSGRTPLTNSGKSLRTSNVSPAWSVDGTQVAYLSNAGGPWDIWVIGSDGSNPHAMFAPGTLKDITFNYKNVDERMISWR